MKRGDDIRRAVEGFVAWWYVRARGSCLAGEVYTATGTELRQVSTADLPKACADFVKKYLEEAPTPGRPRVVLAIDETELDYLRNALDRLAAGTMEKSARAALTGELRTVLHAARVVTVTEE